MFAVDINQLPCPITLFSPLENVYNHALNLDKINWNTQNESVFIIFLILMGNQDNNSLSYRPTYPYVNIFINKNLHVINTICSDNIFIENGKSLKIIIGIQT